MSEFNILKKDWYVHIMKLGAVSGIAHEGKRLEFHGTRYAAIAFLDGKESMDKFIDDVNSSNDITLEKMKEIKKSFKKALESKLHKPLEQMWESKLNETAEDSDNLSLSKLNELHNDFLNSEEIIQFQAQAMHDIYSSIEDHQTYVDTKEFIKSLLKTPSTTATASSMCLPYTNDNIKSLLDQFAIQANDLKLPLMLKLGGNEHELTCGYDPREDRWLLYDVNQQPYYGQSNTDQVLDYIWKGLAKNDTENEIIALKAEVISNKLDLNRVKDHFSHNNIFLNQEDLKHVPTPMLELCLNESINSDFFDSVKLLLSHPDVSIDTKEVALINASLNNKAHVVNLILASSVMPDHFIRTAMSAAIMEGRTSCISNIANSPQTSNSAIDFALEKAIDLENERAITLLLRTGRPSKECIETCLINAMRDRNSGLTSLILSEMKTGINQDQDVSPNSIPQFNPLRSDWHNHIMKLVDDTGLKRDSTGLCYGGSATAIQAFLLGKDSLSAFIESVNASNNMTHERMNDIQAKLTEAATIGLKTPLAPFVEKFKIQMAEARKTNPNLTQEEEVKLRREFWNSKEIKEVRDHYRTKIYSDNPDFKDLNDTKALLQNIKVNFDASLYKPILLEGAIVKGQKTVTESFKVFQPETEDEVQRKKTTIVALSNNVLPYMREDVTTLINNVIKIADDLNEPLCLHLGGNRHRISCSYDPIDKAWLLFDMNQQPYYGTISPQVVGEFIWEGLAPQQNIVNSERTVLILNTELMTTEFNAQKVKDHLFSTGGGPDPKGLLDVQGNNPSDEVKIETFKEAVHYKAVETLKVILDLPEVDKGKFLAFLTYALEDNDSDVVRTIACSDKMTGRMLRTAMNDAISLKCYKSVRGLIDVPAVTGPEVILYLQKAITQKNTELIAALASSPKLSDTAKISALKGAINHNDLDTLKILVASFKKSIHVVEAGLTHAIHKKNSVAAGIIIELGGLQKPTSTTKATISFVGSGRAHSPQNVSNTSNDIITPPLKNK